MGNETACEESDNQATGNTHLKNNRLYKIINIISILNTWVRIINVRNVIT